MILPKGEHVMEHKFEVKVRNVRRNDY